MAVVEPQRRHKPDGGSDRHDAVARTSAWAALLVTLLAVGCYLNSLHGEFVMDDSAAIVGNEDVSLTSSFWAMWQHDYWGDPIASVRSHKSYRPLTVLTFRLNNLDGALSVVRFHATNVALHALASVLVLAVAASTLQLRGVTAVACAALFAVHPIHTEAVSSIVGRAEVLCACFFCVGILCYSRAVALSETNSRKSRVVYWQLVAASVACIVLGTLCKETGITLVAVLTAVEVTQGWRNTGGVIDAVPAAAVAGRCTVSRGVRLAVVWATAAALLGVRAAITVTSFGPTFSRVDNPIAYASSWGVRAMSFAHLHTKYASLLVAPTALSCDYSFDAIPLVTSPFDLRNAASIALYMAVAGAVYVAFRRRDRALLLGLALGIAPFVPASNVFVYAATSLGERLLYMPSIGACVVAAWLWDRMPRVPGMVKHLVLVGVVAYLAQRTVVRNEDWRSPVSLFSAGVQAQPRSCKLRVCLATAHLEQHNYTLAMRHAREALDIYPSYPGAEYVLGLAYDKQGSQARARKHYLRAIKLGQEQEFVPDVVVSAANNLGILYMQQGGDGESLARAEQLFRQALEVDGERHSLLSNLGEVLKMQRRYREAIPYYEAALRLREDASVHNNLGMSLFEARGMEALHDAGAHYARAVELDPNHTAALDNASQVYVYLKLYHKAIPMLRRLTKLRPGDAKFEHRLRKALKARRDGQGARRASATPRA